MIMKDPSAVNKHDCNLRRFMKHMRSFSSHRNNINTITITAGEWAPQNMFYKIHIFIAIKSAHFLGPRVKWGKNLRWFMVMLCSAGCGYDRWLMIVFPSILQCLQTEFFQQKLVCFAAINLELTNNRCLHRKSWELYEADPRDAALGSVFLEATFNPKSNILGLISGNVC